MANLLKCISIIAILGLVGGFLSTSAHATPQTVATVYLSEGTTLLRHSGASAWLPVNVGDPLVVGDTVRTAEDGKAAFQFVDGALVRLGRLSALTFNEVTPAGAPSVTQSSGKTFFFSRGAQKEPSIRTPLVNAAIYGTELVVTVSDDATTIDVLHGAIKASNKKEEAGVGAGESLVARRGEPLKRSILVRPADSVQWMIRFPFILATHDIVPASDSSCNASCTFEIQEAITRVDHGASLYEAVKKLPSTVRATPRGIIMQAVALWRIGDGTSALQALSSLPSQLGRQDDALKYLLLGFTALQAQEIAKAEQYLGMADSLQEGLINADLLRSYISQSHGEIDTARSIVAKTRQSHPDTAELYDRESELLLSSDNYEDATEIISARNQRFGASATSSTLAGFAALSNKDFKSAQTLFEQAIHSDSSQSLAYLGQALLHTRQRDYDQAKDRLSHAVQLDPSVAVYRSYLGKLFFEDERSSTAIREFDAAIALDPNDPTPYLYRSYAQIAENDPIAGLNDVERSISLNEGRAVYRSKLLLDRDLGVRSAGLARTFSELGFSEAARIEAIKSITDDYSNFSAHRLLSDSYGSILDTEANLSEQRIADLLAPLSFNLFNSVGEQSSLGDYNSLFDKKETRKASDITWDSHHDQIGGSLLATGKGDDYGYLLSYRPFYAYGSRHGAYFGDNTLRGALQYETSQKDRFVLDSTFKMHEVEGHSEGDYAEDVHIGTLRLGYNHRFSTNLTFLMQAEVARDSEQTAEQLIRDIAITVPGFSEDPHTEALIDERLHQRVQRDTLSSQLVYSSHYLDSVFGGEVLYADSSRREESPILEIADVPPFDEIRTSSAGNLKSGQVYEYLSLKIPRQATLTLGATAIRVERDLTEVAPFLDGSDVQNRIDPKLGLVLTPTSWLTGRFAYFEGTRKTVLEDLSSLEPTLVGGINQRFNDLSGARSRNLGFGLDLKDANLLYAGAQYTRRHIIDSFGDVSDYAAFDFENTTQLTPRSSGFIDSHADSDILRSYIYTVITPRSVLTADSLFEKFTDTDPDIEGTTSTQRYRLGYKYFFGKHLSVGTQATYRDQQLSGFDDVNGFWLCDLGVNYRLSEQRGRVFARIDNIFDRDFTYDQSRGLEPTVLEGRSFVVGVTYNFW